MNVLLEDGRVVAPCNPLIHEPDLDVDGIRFLSPGEPDYATERDRATPYALITERLKRNLGLDALGRPFSIR